MKQTFIRLLVGVAAASLSTAPVLAQAGSYPVPKAAKAATSPTPAAQPNSPVSPTIQEVRRQLLKPESNSFYAHEMADLFDTRSVPRAGPVHVLPHADAIPDVRFSWAGQSYGFEDFLTRTRTNTLIVLKDGQIVTERYLNRTGPQTHFMSWSMAKSITSTMVGIALAEGKIASLDDQVSKYLPELKGGGYDGATIRNVLEMKSGVAYQEVYDGTPGLASQNHEMALMQNVQRFADPARTIGRANPPGKVFQYKTLDTAVLGWLVERVADRPIAFYMAEKVWEPLGAEADGFFIMDGPPGAGREFTGAGFNAVARDYARFGQMILDRGKVGKRQIVSPEWIAQATASAIPEGQTGGYGYQWWTVPDSNAFYALGLEGQFIYVDPDTRTVIVKLSYFPLENQALYGETLSGLAALSVWKPVK